jgi:hypothetical protein
MKKTFFIKFFIFYFLKLIHGLPTSSLGNSDISESNNIYQQDHHTIDSNLIPGQSK